MTMTHKGTSTRPAVHAVRRGGMRQHGGRCKRTYLHVWHMMSHTLIQGRAATTGMRQGARRGYT